MASSTFGLDAESIRRHHFPFLDAFSTGSRPTLATVTEAITEEAALMSGALSLENVSASAITVDSDAYVLCRKTLRLQVAARLARDIPGADSDLARSWQASVEAWYASLAKGGASFLGDGAAASGASDPDGPTWHGSEYSLTTDSGSDMSTTIPMLRKDDQL